MKTVLTTFASLALIAALAAVFAWLVLVHMPGRTFRGTPPPPPTISLESIGYFRDEEGSQQYPAGVGWLYPSRGNFIALRGATGATQKRSRDGRPTTGSANPPQWCKRHPERSEGSPNAQQSHPEILRRLRASG